MKYTIADSCISLFFGGDYFTVNNTDPRFESVKKELMIHNYSLVEKIVHPTKYLKMPKLQYKVNKFYWDGVELPINFYKILVTLAPTGKSLVPYIHYIIDHIRSYSIESFIESVAKNEKNFIPLDYTGRFFLECRNFNVEDTKLEDVLYAHPELISKIQNSGFEYVQDYFDKTYNKPIIDFFRKNESYVLRFIDYWDKFFGLVNNYADLNIVNLEQSNNIYRTICEREEYIQFSMKLKSFSRIVKFFKAPTQIIRDTLTMLSHAEMLRFEQLLIDQSKNMNELHDKTVQEYVKIGFVGDDFKYYPPLNLKKFRYFFKKDKDIYSISFPRSYSELKMFGVIYSNCAASYHQRVSKGHSIVFSIMKNGEYYALGEISNQKIGKGKFVNLFNSEWKLQQFVGKYNNHYFNEKEPYIPVLKKLKELGIIIISNKKKE